ncbi:MAG: FAD-dependent 5-carboxymethylaminomethyl-2-thiouridine(34) oxidoreductase MnmC [Pseudomonadota bacterium]
MPERIDWLEDGTASGAPYSPRFGDRYRGEHGGLEQARDVFLAGCGLPAAWNNQPQWRILETGFGLGLNFLVTWQAWKADANRPQFLHFVSTEAFPASADDVLRGSAAHPALLPLANQLHAQLWGLLPGFHRLVFEQGRVLLTLCVGDAKVMLRQQQFEADSVYLDGFSPQKNPDIWDVYTVKAVARCCRRGTRIATWTIARAVRDALAQAGFVVQKTPGIPPKRDNLQGEYQPGWEPKGRITTSAPASRPAGTCAVIGAGLAGAAVAASLARRGWQVTVLDEADTPAAGASALPAGLLAPHVSPDDSLLSRLSRSGVRMTLQQVTALLAANDGWAPTGVLQHVLGDADKNLSREMLQQWPDAYASWTRIATQQEMTDNGLSTDSKAFWHNAAGWIKPASLVNAWLATPGITWRGDSKVSGIAVEGHGWTVAGTAGEILASADMVVLAAGYGSRALAASLLDAPIALQAIRGQVSMTAEYPPCAGSPVNGHGSFIPEVPLAQGNMAIFGASFERDCERAHVTPVDHADNLNRLKELLPDAQMPSPAALDGWAGIRCATPQRLPVVAPISSRPDGGQVWLCSGMGSRGLSFAHLCAELMASRLHGEPLPLEARLAQAIESLPSPAPKN